MLRFQHNYKVSNRTQVLKNNAGAESPAEAALQVFRRALGRRDLVVVQTSGPAGESGYFAAYYKVGTELVAVPRTESLKVEVS